MWSPVKLAKHFDFIVWGPFWQEIVLTDHRQLNATIRSVQNALSVDTSVSRQFDQTQMH